MDLAIWGEHGGFLSLTDAPVWWLAGLLMHTVVMLAAMLAAAVVVYYRVGLGVSAAGLDKPRPAVGGIAGGGRRGDAGVGGGGVGWVAGGGDFRKSSESGFTGF